MNDTRKFTVKMNGVEGKTPFLIGVAGGTASGKSTVCKRIMEKLGQVDKDQTERQVVCISQDSFYRDLSAAEIIRADKGQFNFDHPDAFDENKILTTLQDILAGRKCKIPVYDYKKNSICPDQTITIYPADVVLFEGILVFYFPRIRSLFHMKLFVDTDSDTRLARRVPRDILERGRDLEQVLNQYMNYVKPAFEEFCLPTKKFADVIIPRGADNTVAIDLIVHHIWDILRIRHSDESGDGVAALRLPNGRHSNGGHDDASSGDERVTARPRKQSGSSEDTLIAIDLIVQHIRDFLNNRSAYNAAMDAQNLSPTLQSPELEFAGSLQSSPLRTGRRIDIGGRPH